MMLLFAFSAIVGAAVQQQGQQTFSAWADPGQHINGLGPQQPQFNGVGDWLQYLQHSHMRMYDHQHAPGQVQHQILNMGLWNVPSQYHQRMSEEGQPRDWYYHQQQQQSQPDSYQQNQQHSYWIQPQQQQHNNALYSSHHQQYNVNGHQSNNNYNNHGSGGYWGHLHGVGALEEDNTSNLGQNTGGYRYGGIGVPPRPRWSFHQNPLYKGTSGKYENYHFQRNAWWKCSEDTTKCFHNMVRMVLEASKSSVCMSGCADKCHFPKIPQHIANLQQVISRIPQDASNKIMIGQCEIPHWDEQKEALANSILQKAYTCRIDMTQLETLEHQVMQEYQKLMSCLETMPRTQ